MEVVVGPQSTVYVGQTLTFRSKSNKIFKRKILVEKYLEIIFKAHVLTVTNLTSNHTSYPWNFTSHIIIRQMHAILIIKI